MKAKGKKYPRIPVGIQCDGCGAKAETTIAGFPTAAAQKIQPALPKGWARGGATNQFGVVAVWCHECYRSGKAMGR